jgi:hypothetical protein
MSGIGVLAALLGIILGGIVAGLVIAFVLVPLMRGIGWLIVNFFKAIGWLIAHVFEYVAGTIGDVLRFISAVIAGVVLLPFAPLNVILGRWSAAGHYADSIKRECKVAMLCLYRVLIRRPLKLFWLHGILEGVEQRLPEAMAAVPAVDRPSRSVGQFDGYRIVGSLPGGGSGAKLYIAEPDAARRARNQSMPQRVVIKSFTLTEGSTLPQIVRESRALDAARQLGLVLDHGMDRNRFFYVMPYHAGDHLGIVTRQIHGEAEGEGLDARGCRTVLGYAIDLAQTLAMYHEGGLWHKDVKPDNIIVRDGRAHLVDLGLVTPLRSAMTLTTHGTEYFRDPEMVRQALRGVKVHQVDGARFDIYAVGAVLYFMLENTFPAHGALSRFAKRSPESLRWIVRRAMAEYNQRYGSAQEMLSDLRAVAAASDPAAVRPADLPSMGGRAAPAEAETACCPGPAAVAPAAVAAAVPGPAAEPAAGPRASSPQARPRLRVTNWWTGAYVIDGGDAVAEREFSHHASQMRRTAARRRDKVRSGSLSARRAAREQIREARARATEMRRRARTGQPRAVAERQPSLALGATVVVFLLLAAGVVFVIAKPRSGGQATSVVHVVDSSPGRIQIKAGEGDPLVLVVDGGDISSSGVREQIKRLVGGSDLEGRGVVWIDTETNQTLAGLLREAGGECAPDALADHLRALSGSGALWVKMDRNAVKAHSTVLLPPPPPVPPVPAVLAAGVVADGVIVEAPSDRPLLLVNDHPVKAHPQVERAVEDLVARYREHRWNVVVDDDAEAQVRLVLPAGPIDPAIPLPPQLQAVLASLELAGVLKIDAAPGEGPAHERMRWTRVDAVAADADAGGPAEGSGS